MEKQNIPSGKRLPLIFALFLWLNGLIAQTTYTITTFAGTGPGYSGDGGPAILAQFNIPYTVCVDALGNLYIADFGNNRVRKVSTTGTITTIAGNGTAGFSGDGGSATSAQLFGPSNICIDGSGNLYIVDSGNNRVRKVSVSGIISTYAGNGTSGFSGDGGIATSAQFNAANGIAIDASNNIYVTDYGNNRIRKITPTGTISTIAGNGTSGYTGDGGLATTAQIAWVGGIAVDNNGNVYITDNSNNVVRKINTSGIISTIAGNGSSGFFGDGGIATSARLSSPYALAFDASNKLYISDNGNNRIRVVGTNSIISTIAGDGTASFSGDGGPAISASMNGPNGIVVDNLATVYFVDQNNSRVRKLIPNATGLINLTSVNAISLYPNPNNGDFKIQIDNVIKNGEIILINSVGQKVYDQKIIQGTNNINTNGLPIGLYNCILLQANRQINSGRLLIE